MKARMIDVLDYSRRLFSAVFLCPVALAFWVLFSISGFNLINLFSMLAGFGHALSGMNSQELWVFTLQFLGVWGSLAFLFLLIIFASNPPKFHYALKRQGSRHVVHVVS